MSKQQQPEGSQLPMTVHEIIAEEEQREARWVRWSMGVAIVAHVVLFVVQWPAMASEPSDHEQKDRKVFVVEQVRFEPPPQRRLQEIPKPKVTVPIPDPTPDDPEPFRHPEEPQDLNIADFPELILDLPAAPPDPEPEGPIIYKVGGGLTEPKRIYSPPPLYPEAARKARMEGTVILECLIDKAGSVVEVKVLRPRPLGLTEAAVAAVERWRFEPSTLKGKPVDVIYVLSVIFRLQ